MKDWWIWSSADLVNWKQEGMLKPEETFLKQPSDSCWATFGATKNGKYYWYFSAGPTEIGVVLADSPAGPWKDPLGKPLVSKGLTDTEQRDPDILIDDDGTAYMVYGTFEFYLVRLNSDMISLAEAPRHLELDRKFGPYGEGKTDDKPSLHKRNGIYYLSWSSFYAISANIYGPYVYKGSVIAPEKAAMTFSAASANPGGGTIEIREGGSQGQLLGTCRVSATGGWEQYQPFSCVLQNPAGTHSLCLTFKGGEGELLRLDWMNFPTGTKRR
jgi:hypothetical protein